MAILMADFLFRIFRPAFHRAVLFFVLPVTAITSASGACAVHTAGAEAVSSDLPPEAPGQFDGNNYLTGDWAGYRKRLTDHGIEITGGYTAEPAGNPSGGRKQGFTYLHNVGLALKLDLEKIAGLPNSNLVISASQRSGRSLTQDSIGNAISVQQVYGGGQTYRLVQIQMNHLLFNDRLDLAYGQLSATNDFMTSPLFCQFVSNAICGQPSAPFFNMPNGITAYPVSTWGVRARVQTSRETYMMFGIYDGGPVGEAGGDDHGLDFGFGDNGVLLLAEAGYKPEHGLFSLPGRYSLGGFYHTGDFEDVSQDAFRTNRILTGLSGRERSGQEGFYLLFEQGLYQPDRSGTDGLTGFLTFVASPDENKSELPYFLNTGLIYNGLIPGRPADKTAAGMYATWFSERKRSAQKAAGVPSQTNECGFEINHQVQFTPYLYLRPNIQYIIKPNGLADIDDALVLGVEVGLVF